MSWQSLEVRNSQLFKPTAWYTVLETVRIRLGILESPMAKIMSSRAVQCWDYFEFLDESEVDQRLLRGSVKKKVEPRPGSDSTQIWPP
jgi:hypothetical protein